MRSLFFSLHPLHHSLPAPSHSHTHIWENERFRARGKCVGGMSVTIWLWHWKLQSAHAYRNTHRDTRQIWGRCNGFNANNMIYHGKKGNDNWVHQKYPNTPEMVTKRYAYLHVDLHQSTICGTLLSPTAKKPDIFNFSHLRHHQWWHLIVYLK